MDDENEEVYMDESPEQTETLDEVMTMISVVGIDFVEFDPYDPPLDTPAKELFDGDIDAYGIFISKLFLYFDVEALYEFDSEFQVFPTLNDVFQTLGEKVLIKRDLI